MSSHERNGVTRDEGAGGFALRRLTRRHAKHILRRAATVQSRRRQHPLRISAVSRMVM